ncbi:ROK family protein [Dactylosporangium sp. CA-092794]|uniref:ROK family protein n=1 Tax=Dactylosporangium sp. CA-092794 TaxID=3239929 RepID=UPI003D8F9657
MPLPTLDLVRSATDEQVLHTLMRRRRLTRAELAAETGLSKPTAGESVRRLAERGLVEDTGERTPGGRGRGRVGSYYALTPATGTALALTIAPSGVVGEAVDAYGDVVARAERTLGRPTAPDRVAAALTAVAAQLTSAVAAQFTGSAASGRAAGGATAVAAELGDPAVPARVAGAATAASGRGAGAAIATSGRGAGDPAAGVGVGVGVAERGWLPRLAVVSAADPVDRATGRLVHLPDAPFLVGELDPVALLGPYVAGPVTVDNDVNWAARAEAEHAGPDFAYLHLGEGLGCAIVGDGEVARGRTGLAGEIAHVVTTGPHGRAVRLIEVFGRLGLRLPGSTAIDADALLAAVAAPSPLAAVNRRTIAVAVAGVVAAVVALADPGRVVVGGTWGPVLVDAIRDATADLPRGAAVEAATVTHEPSLSGARRAALTRLRAAIVATVHGA